MGKWLTVFFILLIVIGPNTNVCASQTPAFQCRDPLISPRVMFVVPADNDSVFWQDVVSYIKIASKQLALTLDIHYLEEEQRSRFNHAQSINDILNASPKPDYLITFLTLGLEQDIIEQINEKQIYLFSFNAPLTPSLIKRVGTPRERYPYWIGHISPNEVDAGYKLADHLIRVSSKEHKDSTENTNLLAISSRKTSHVGTLREQGLKQRIIESPDIQLLQSVDADWSYKKTRFMMNKLLKRHGNIDIIWAASDLISIAAFDEITAYKPNMLNSVTIGSIDWTSEVKPYLEDGRIAVSYGGHVFEAGWLIPLIFDHHNNYDFYNELGGVISDKMQAITAVNAHFLAKEQLANINFSNMSKCYTGQNHPYEFNARTLIELSTDNSSK